MLEACKPLVDAGIPIVGLEPSCLLTLRDELGVLLPGDDARRLGNKAMLFEEFIASEQEAGTLQLKLNPLPAERALVHGHCHQKAFGAFDSVTKVLKMIPELEVQTIESSCCGMAGSFGYDEEHYDVSVKMAEGGLVQAVRGAPSGSVVVADGTSCRHQIADCADTDAVHVARLLEQALPAPTRGASSSLREDRASTA